MRLDHLLSKENCVGQTRGSAIGEGTEVVVQFSVRDSSLKEKRDPINQWGCSSVGRAPALQAGGQEFESLHLHQGQDEARTTHGLIAQQARACA